MQSVFNSIDENCELEFISFSHSRENGYCFYLSEQSSFQLFKEFDPLTPVKIVSIFSQRKRIAQKAELIKKAITINSLLEIITPLVENGNFPCDKFIFEVNEELQIESRNDDVLLICSKNKTYLMSVVQKIAFRQGYYSLDLKKIMEQPNLFHKIDVSGNIIKSYFNLKEFYNEE